MEAGAGVRDIDRQRLGVGAQHVLVLRDRAVGPLVGLLRIDVEAPAHGRLPGLAAIAGTVDAAPEGAVFQLAGHGAVQHDAGRIGATGKSFDLLPRQPMRLLRPRLPAVVGPPDALVRGGEHARPCSTPALGGGLLCRRRLAFGTRAGRPRHRRLVGVPNAICRVGGPRYDRNGSRSLDPADPDRRSR